MQDMSSNNAKRLQTDHHATLKCCNGKGKALTMQQCKCCMVKGVKSIVPACLYVTTTNYFTSILDSSILHTSLLQLPSNRQ